MSSPRTDLPEVLVRAAEAEIDEKGIGAVSLRAIARRAGVSHQAPGHHFRDRAGLLTALAIDGFERLIALMDDYQARIADDAPATHRLGAAGAAYIAFAEAHPAVFSVMVRPELQREEDSRLVQARAAAFEILLRAVDAARAEGWGAGHDTRTLALVCWTSVHGAATLWGDGVLGIFYADTSLEELARRVMDVITAALDR